jgi:hypothetical protein
MTISTVQPLHIGNALRLFIEPPAGAVLWRVLRKGTDSFTDQNDPSAFVAYEGNEKIVVDSASLPNDVMAFYRPFYTTDGSAWTAGPTAYGTPASIYEEHTTDAMTLVRARLEAGLKVEVERQNLSNELGYIQVYTAPPSLEQNLFFPLVTITLDCDSSDIRAIGENISGDEFDSIGFDWLESEGWLANVQLAIVGWSLNSDERMELRKAIRRIIVSNLPVFAADGIDQVNLSMNDVDAVNGEYGAPLYQVMANFSCVAPVRVGGRVGAITDVISTLRST